MPDRRHVVFVGAMGSGKTTIGSRVAAALEYIRIERILMNGDEAVEYLADDELLEVTPQSYRIRKRILNMMSAVRIQRRRRKNRSKNK